MNKARFDKGGSANGRREDSAGMDRRRTAAARLVSLDDAQELAALLRTNREFLAPWEPVRSEGYFTANGQRADIGEALEMHRRGSALPYVALDESAQVVGRITLSGIV